MHDYDFPPEWPSMDPDERDRWFKQERARRQARAQTTAFAARQRTEKARHKRRSAARNDAVLGTVDE